ncbi:acyltransferase [Belnapia sp. T18]|uniref:Acyltransferase n=1 Tax=Belnapia arida TaxID=2804533 RepID=A0ABS1UAS4_9PROT|nr:acyltransferase [Belnapia arida]MBL6081788.1 acyltransferase [Belnapia arida]
MMCQPKKEYVQRWASIDAARYALSFLVVLLHSLPAQASSSFSTTIIATICRTAVPFFFIAAGYFLNLRDTSCRNLVTKICKRLMPIYFFWMAIYYILFEKIFGQQFPVGFRELLSGGPAYHLWFLPALCFALIFVGVGRSLFGVWMTGSACIVLATTSLINGAYHDVLGLTGSGARGGILIAPMYVFIGSVLSSWVTNESWRTSLIAAIIAFSCMICEEFFIHVASKSNSWISHDFVLSTFLVGVVTFKLVQKIPECSLIRFLARLGRVSLSVYSVHLAVLLIIIKFADRGSTLECLLAAGYVFAIATALSVCLVRVPGLKPFVT